MSQGLRSNLEAMDLRAERIPQHVNEEVAQILKTAGYTVALHEYERPWGGFNQLSNEDADKFVSEFFPDITSEEARLGNPSSPLSPKILTVAPGQRLSWQYHERRTERWAYLTAGGYFRSLTDEQGELHQASAGEVIQFEKSERHRLVGAMGQYTLVAEIWQHVDPDNLSDESDIIRIQDDYKR